MSFRVRQTHTLINTPLKSKAVDAPQKKENDGDDVDDQKVAVVHQPAAPSDSSRVKNVGASFTVRPNFGGKSDYY
jgi:hypothetical protein